MEITLHKVLEHDPARSAVALYSGEAELYGMVKGSPVGLGIQSVLKYFNVECGIVLKNDASAATAIASRRGLGKVRHIEVCQLRLQENFDEEKAK